MDSPIMALSFRISAFSSSIWNKEYMYKIQNVLEYTYNIYVYWVDVSMDFVQV